MVGFVWTCVGVCAVLSADYGFDRYRDWRGKKRAQKYGRTLTQKFHLLHD